MIGFARDRLNALSASERALVAIAALLAVALAGTTFLLAPLREAHADARTDYESSARLLDEARTGAALAAARRAERPEAAGADPRAVVTSSALSRGLAIARMTPVDRGGLSVRLERADPAALYAWLAELDDRHGVIVRRATVRRAGGGESAQIEADIVLSGGGAT
jgi:type II secretory pathway component PulM